MKNLGKLGAAAFAFASIANKSLAVDQTSKSASMGISDLAPFAFGALLIIGVLFIGYKMDKASESMPTTRKEKAPKKSKGKRAKEEYTPAQEAEVYAEENKSDMPYEEDENEYYESDNGFDDLSGLDEETEYEEDDVSLFSTATEQESSFNDIDDNISYDVEEKETFSTPEPVAEPVAETVTEVAQEPVNSVVEPEEKEVGFGEFGSASDSENFTFDSTMIFDSTEINGASAPETAAEEEEDFEYSAPVEGLDAKIDGLDDLDDFENNTTISEPAKAESDDAQSFMNELNKYKEEAEEEEAGFAGFTTAKSTQKEDVEEEEEESNKEAQVTESHVRRYTKKKSATEVEEQEIPDFGTTPSKKSSTSVYEKEAEETVPEDTFVEEPSGQMDIGFLNQMEQNLKRSQEERMKNAGVDLDSTEEEPKKRGRKSKK